MIRIDWYESKGYIITRWIQELQDKHSYIGKLTLDIDEFNKLSSLLSGGKLDSDLKVKFERINLGDKNDSK